EGYEHLGQSVQISPRQTVNVGNVQVGTLTGTHAHRRLEFVVARATVVRQQEQGVGSRQLLRPGNKQIIGAAGEVVKSSQHMRAQFAVDLEVPGHIVRCTTQVVARRKNLEPLLTV